MTATLLHRIFGNIYRNFPRTQTTVLGMLSVVESIRCCDPEVDTLYVMAGKTTLYQLDLRAHLRTDWVSLPYPLAICCAPYMGFSIVAEKAGQIRNARLNFSGFTLPLSEISKYITAENHTSFQAKRYRITYQEGSIGSVDTRPGSSKTLSKL